MKSLVSAIFGLGLLAGLAPASGITAEKLADLELLKSADGWIGTYPRGFRTVGDRIYFVASDDGVRNLWTTDGTADGTLPIVRLPLWQDVDFLADDGRRLFFLMGPAYGILDLWASDGTAAGTVQLTDRLYVPGVLYGNRFAHVLSDRGLLVFEVRTQAGSVPWVTDGTPGGTRPLVDPETQELGSMRPMVGSRREAYFAVMPGDGELATDQLWRTDGTPEGTRLVEVELSFSGFSYEMLSDSLLVVTGNAERGEARLWNVSPDAEAPVLVEDRLLAPDGSNDWSVAWTLDLGHRAVFSVSLGTTYTDILPPGGPIDVETERWSTDGTPDGTLPFAEDERIPVAASFLYYAPVVVDGVAYFFGSDPEHGLEVWRSDGLPGGARRLTDLCPGRCHGVDPYLLELVGSHLVVTGTDGKHGWEPWVVPVEEGLEPWTLGDLCPGECGSDPTWIQQVGRDLVLAVDTECAVCGQFVEIWVSDLTPSGARPLAVPFHVQTDSRLAHERALLGNRLVLPVGDSLEADPWVIVGEPDACDPILGAACFQDGDVEVTVRWELGNGESGPGKGVPMTDRAAYFWFFGDSNIELVVKLLDGCRTNGRRWFFVSGLTDVGVEIELRDFATLETRRYVSPAGKPFSPILDTSALSCPGG